MATNSNAVGIIEAASFLGVHPQTVRKLAKKGEIPCYKVGRQWRFHRSALQQWIDAQRTRQQAPLVLVADDEKSMRETVAAALEQAGYRVDKVSDGAIAIQHAQRELPDLAILDLMMPKASGVDVLREIRAMDSEISVIVMTGYPDGDLMAKALAFSPFTVLAKPVALNKVLATVDQILSRPAVGTATTPIPNDQ